jgi:hypothetical protein
VITSSLFADVIHINNQQCAWYIAPPCASSVTLSFTEFDIERISKKLKSRSKKLKIVYDAIEVLESNLIRAEEFLKNN